MSVICGVLRTHEQSPLRDVLSQMIDHGLLVELRGSNVCFRKLNMLEKRIGSDGRVGLAFEGSPLKPKSLEERLPFEDAASGVIITADARIDNRDELAQVFGLSRSQCDQMPDSQFILKAYEKWGVDCAEHLLGDFAFALWDERKRRLFAARDFIGARPFYYHYSTQGSARGNARQNAQGFGCRFVFASDMSAILAAPNVNNEPDWEYLSAHFRNGANYPHLTRTFYQGIRKLARGHALLVDADGRKTWRWWRPESLHETRMKTDDDYADALRELLDRSVRARVRSAFPVGAHLSGGLDSSAAAVLASRMLRERGQELIGFSWAPPPANADPEDERSLVEQLRATENIPVHYTDVEPADVIESRLCSPGFNHDAEFVHELAVRRNAAARGVRVILSGWGGDELIAFNGRGYFANLLRRGRWVRLSRELHRRAEIHGGPIWKSFIIKAVLPLLPDWALEKFLPQTLPMLWEETPLPDGLQPDAAARLRSAIPLPHKRAREKVGVRNEQLGLLAREHLTRRIEGWASAGARSGITYAYPLLDRRIVEFALTLPPEMFFKNGWKRYLFRRATSGVLPDEVRWNKTKKEPALVDDRARVRELAQEILKPFVRELLAKPRNYRYLDAEQVCVALQQQMDDEAAPKRPGALGALFTELLVNRELACDIQHHVAQMRNTQKRAA